MFGERERRRGGIGVEARPGLRSHLPNARDGNLASHFRRRRHHEKGHRLRHFRDPENVVYLRNECVNSPSGAARIYMRAVLL